MTIFQLYNDIIATINVTHRGKYFWTYQTHFHSKLLNYVVQIKLIKLKKYSVLLYPAKLVNCVCGLECRPMASNSGSFHMFHMCLYWHLCSQVLEANIYLIKYVKLTYTRTISVTNPSNCQSLEVVDHNTSAMILMSRQ